MLLRVAGLVLCIVTAKAIEKNAYDPDYGFYIGDLSNLSDGDISGSVYVVNETTVQILNFTYNGKAPDLYFWLDESEKPTPEGYKIPTFEYGITPLGKYENAQRVVLTIPNPLRAEDAKKVKDFKTLSLYCLKYDTNFGFVQIPESLSYPKPQLLSDSQLKGSRYNIESGPIAILDRRTLKVYGFSFEADKAPDGYFFVGRGLTVAAHAGVKVPIRGRDTPESITAMNERYRGGQDIILDLPESYDIEHIDWLAIYCYKFQVDFGHVAITLNTTSKIPPYVPPQQKYDEIPRQAGWKHSILYGTPNHKNFTFQIGVPGGAQGYEAMTRAQPSKFVWYVNGQLAELILKRGETYTLIVEGGDDKSSSNFYNPLYIGNDKEGGYNRLSKAELQSMTILSGPDANAYAGRLCMWSNEDHANPDHFKTFSEFRKTLRLSCEPDKDPAVFTFTPNQNTSDVIYYQSASNFNMGFKIQIVDELPSNITEYVDEPYIYEDWLRTQEAREDRASSSSSLHIATSIVLFGLSLLR